MAIISVLYVWKRTSASCGSDEIGCAVTYSFKNQAKLGQDVENFKVNMKFYLEFKLHIPIIMNELG